MTVWMVVPCHRERLNWLSECVKSSGIPRNRVVIVTNGPDPIREDEIEDYAKYLITDHSPEINISRWWNLGMGAIHRMTEGRIDCRVNGHPQYEILVANADTISSDEVVEGMRSRLRSLGVAAVAPDQAERLLPGESRVSHDPNDYAFTQHMWGYFFMLAGEKKLRANEDMRWWLSDNAVEIEAKLHGGFALLGGLKVDHRAQTPYEEPWITMGNEDRVKLDCHYWDLDYFAQRG